MFPQNFTYCYGSCLLKDYQPKTSLDGSPMMLAVFIRLLLKLMSIFFRNVPSLRGYGNVSTISLLDLANFLNKDLCSWLCAWCVIMFIWVLWYIWLARNKLLFCNQRLFVSQVMEMAYLECVTNVHLTMSISTINANTSDIVFIN